MKRYDCCIILLFIFFVIIFSVEGDDIDTMLALSKNLPPSSNNKIWNTNNKNPCMWEGVNCTSLTSHQVINLTISGLGLTTSATNPASAVPFFKLLCSLSSLQLLDLSRNSFSFIPATFFSNCKGLHSQLKTLDLSFNSLNCNLSGFSGFPSLEALALSSNQFSGEIPAEIFQLKNLSFLDLSMNNLSGTIPKGFAALPKLKTLALSSNQFGGEIPAEILQLKNLSILDLSMNYLSGTIPEGIAALPKLKCLILSFNNLTGEIPTNLSTIRTLSFFYASSNNLTGRIPGEITRNLMYLDLSYNQLNGYLSSDLLSPPSLKFVDLTHNLLDGPIPGNLSASLYRLRLGGNNLRGDISALFERPSNISYLELENNQLEGEIPSHVGNWPKLLLLDLAANRLQGLLRKELGNLSRLVILKLQENNLSGDIPAEISKLAGLNTLNVSHNSLSGKIPSEISNLQELTFLHLEDNKLSGQIPNSIINLRSLIELQLGNNNLSGTVPKMPPSLSSLNLSSNNFSSPIPPYLGDLTQLEILDLSRNNFTGEVPPSLASMQSLTLLILSYNQLNGTLPHFPHFVSVNTAGNKDLLNSTSPPPAPPKALPKKSKPSTLIIVVSVVSAIFGVGLLSAFLLILLSKRLCGVEDEGLQLQLQESPPQIIKGSFLSSDSKHRSSIDFTKAMEVVSSPSNIMLKTRFSTYFKASMPSGTCYTVKKLNWSDRIFQMGSNERFGQELNAIGRLTNSNIMVPLAYVLTQDSAYLFYENVHKGTLYDFLHKGSENSLDWQSRYSIALGVAQGLTFLHGCNEAVLLLDLSTKSIHLKSMNEPQIGDIELSKVIDPSKSTGGLSTIAGSVGYIPPEYAYTMRMTPAANVYSFGVILLELLTGKQSISGGIELAKWAASFAERPEQKQEILDPSVSKASLAVRSQMLSVLKVALSCVSLSPEARPKMRNVLRMLFNAR